MNELVDDPMFMDTVIASNPALQRAIEVRKHLLTVVLGCSRGRDLPQRAKTVVL